MNKILEIRKITKKYNNIPVVNSISFVAKPCEILGYLGPNGAGKTTTIKMLQDCWNPIQDKYYSMDWILIKTFLNIKRE